MDGIADYEFLRKVGDGNYGSYYLARSPARLGLASAVVVVKVVAGHTTDTFRRAVRELKAFAAVRSPYLVRLLDAGQQGGTFFYAREWLRKGSLADPEGEVSRADVLVAVAHAARAAHALHEAGIVHRDIEPGNVLLAEDGGRLADLGLAQLLQPGVTVTGVGRLESLEYIDPSVLTGGRPSRQTDVYSLGVTLHKSLSGRGIYTELPRQPLMAIRAVLSGTPIFDVSLVAGERDLVADCVDPELAGRPGTALEVAQRIESLPGQSRPEKRRQLTVK